MLTFSGSGDKLALILAESHNWCWSIITAVTVSPQQQEQDIQNPSSETSGLQQRSWTEPGRPLREPSTTSSTTSTTTSTTSTSISSLHPSQLDSS